MTPHCRIETWTLLKSKAAISSHQWMTAQGQGGDSNLFKLLMFLSDSCSKFGGRGSEDVG